jgi:hypothetical protein
MIFHDRILVRGIDVRALVRMLLDDVEALVREIDVGALMLQNQHSENNLTFLIIINWFTKQHFSNLDDENFDRLKILYELRCDKTYSAHSRK